MNLEDKELIIELIKNDMFDEAMELLDEGIQENTSRWFKKLAEKQLLNKPYDELSTKTILEDCLGKYSENKEEVDYFLNMTKDLIEKTKEKRFTKEVLYNLVSELQ